MNHKYLKYYLLLVSVVLLLAACTKSKKTETVTPAAPEHQEEREPHGNLPDYKPFNTVVTTDYLSELIYQFARTRTRGRALIPRGTDPLNYVPAEKDKQDILDADVVFYNGLGLEPHFQKIFTEAEKITRVYDISKAIPKEKLIASEKYTSGFDPHYFKDPDIWIHVVEFLVKTLSEIDPEGSYNYGSIYLRYGESLSLHDKRYLEPWSSALPENRRYLITLYDSFNYTGRRYGYQTHSLLAPGQTQVSIQRLEQLASYIIKNKIPAIFYEESFSSEPMEKLQQEVQNRGGQVKLAGPLHSYFKGPMGGKFFAYIPSGRFEMNTVYDALKTEEMKPMPR